MEVNVVWNNEKISGAASNAAIDRIKEQNITAADSTIINLQPTTIAFKKLQQAQMVHTPQRC
jgi:hypothetical protein